MNIHATYLYLLCINQTLKKCNVTVITTVLGKPWVYPVTWAHSIHLVFGDLRMFWKFCSPAVSTCHVVHTTNLPCTGIIQGACTRGGHHDVHVMKMSCLWLNGITH